MNKHKVAVIMGSQSDFDTMKNSIDILENFGIEVQTSIVSAHRTPDRLYEFSKNAEKNNIKIIIAGAGGAAHLPGMVASLTIIPVLGVPIKSKSLKGLDSLLSIAQMPAGIAVGTLAIGEAGAKNAAFLAASILSLQDSDIKDKLNKYREKQTLSVKEEPIEEN